MISVLFKTIGGVLVFALFPFFLFLFSITLGAKGFLRKTHRESAKKYRFLILIPAHNEESSISDTLKSCQLVDYPEHGYDLCVIADNCSDNTAQVAKAQGARVIERHDLAQKSKGHGLSFALGLLLQGEFPYDAVVIIDADTHVDAGLLSSFARLLEQGEQRIQGYYLVRNPQASWRTQLMNYAFSLFNGVWVAGQCGIGLSAPLRGNGMCFSTDALREIPWQAYGLAEDLEYAWILRLKGKKVCFDPNARVFGEMVVSDAAASASQRKRWEEGRAALKKRFFKELVLSHLSWPKKALYTLDLAFPPLSRLFVGLVFAFVFLSVGTLLNPTAFPGLAFLVLSASSLFLAAYLLSPFVFLGLPLSTLKSFGSIPRYIAWKASLLFQKKSQGWVRTKRESGSR